MTLDSKKNTIQSYRSHLPPINHMTLFTDSVRLRTRSFTLMIPMKDSQLMLKLNYRMTFCTNPEITFRLPRQFHRRLEQLSPRTGPGGSRESFATRGFREHPDARTGTNICSCLPMFRVLIPFMEGVSIKLPQPRVLEDPFSSCQGPRGLSQLARATLSSVCAWF